MVVTVKRMQIIYDVNSGIIDTRSLFNFIHSFDIVKKIFYSVITQLTVKPLIVFSTLAGIIDTLAKTGSTVTTGRLQTWINNCVRANDT